MCMNEVVNYREIKSTVIKMCFELRGKKEKKEEKDGRMVI